MRLLVLTLGVLALATSASGQWLATGFLGNVATSPVRLTVSSPNAMLAIEPVALRDESSASPWYYGARVTRQFARPRWLGVEGEFIHAKVISDAAQMVRIRGRFGGVAIDGDRPLGTVLPRFELSHGLNFVLANAVGFWPIGRTKTDPLFALVGRLGAGPTVPHVEVTFDGQDENAYQFGGAALAAAVGGQIRLMAHVDAVVEFKLTRTWQHVEAGTAKIEGTFTTRHTIAGLSWHADHR